MKFCEKITVLRKRKGWSQEELASMLDVSRQAIYKWEAGITTPELTKIKKLSELFGASYDELLNDGIEISDGATTINEQDQKPTANGSPCVQNTPSEVGVEAVKESKAPIFISIGAMAFVLLVIALVLILRSCLSDGDDYGGDAFQSGGPMENILNDYTINIITGEGSSQSVTVRTTKYKHVTLDIPKTDNESVLFVGYYMASGEAVTDENGTLFEGLGTEKSLTLYPHYKYYVYDAEDLIALASFAPACSSALAGTVDIELANDIDLSSFPDWTPLEGIHVRLDGRSYKIKNLKSTQGGLFLKSIGKDAYVKNLEIENASIDVSELGENPPTAFAPLISYIDGTVENVSVSGTVKIILERNQFVAACGVVGMAKNVVGCVNNATVKTNTCAASGIVYGANTVSGCVNNGSVSAEKIGTSYYGGASGIVNHGLDYQVDYVISDCVNTGKIYSSGSDAAGIAIDMDADIERCYNTGEIVGADDAAGIIVSHGEGKISYCYNTATVTGSFYSAGIAATADTSEITQCYNSGNVSSKAGIAFYVMSGATVSDCFVLDGQQIFVSSTDSALIKNCHVYKNNKSLFTETLAWSTEIWSFDSELPTLK